MNATTKSYLFAPYVRMYVVITYNSEIYVTESVKINHVRICKLNIVRYSAISP